VSTSGLTGTITVRLLYGHVQIWALIPHEHLYSEFMTSSIQLLVPARYLAGTLPTYMPSDLSGATSADLDVLIQIYTSKVCDLVFFRFPRSHGVMYSFYWQLEIKNWLIHAVF
jgi:hypothetical protein